MAKIDTREIQIPSILKVEKDLLRRIGGYLADEGIYKVVILFGNGLIDMFGHTVMEGMSDSGVEVLQYMEMDTVRIDDLVQLAFSFPNTAQAVLGIGGGKVVDAAKYCGFLRKLPFISVPTSASSDGFSSASASLIVEGRRKSVPAGIAYGIFADIDAIKGAPEAFLFSGIGDMVSKKAVNSFVRTPFKDIHDERFIKELLDSLAMSGVANEIAGDSAPTSGSEHLISHALDQMLERPQLHGIQVGVATYLMSVVQDHRYERINTVFTDTGFWDYVKTVGMKREDFIRAIEKAPAIKPFRYTYLHEEQYRKKAIEVLQSDTKLSEVLQA